MAEGVLEPFPELKSREELQTYLRGVAEERGVSLESAEVAQELDRRDQLATFRKKFAIPTIGQLLDEDERDECKKICMTCCMQWLSIWQEVP